jgi:hypothetical protein
LYHETPEEIRRVIEKSGKEISKVEWTTVTQKGKKETAFHINIKTSLEQMAEIVVRTPDQAGCSRKCEIFGDELKGLTIKELIGVLEKDPAQKFIPEKPASFSPRSSYYCRFTNENNE